MFFKRPLGLGMKLCFVLISSLSAPKSVLSSQVSRPFHTGEVKPAQRRDDLWYLTSYKKAVRSLVVSEQVRDFNDLILQKTVPLPYVRGFNKGGRQGTKKCPVFYANY